MSYQKNSTTKIKSYKKSASLLVALILLCTIGIGSTVAYIIDKTDELANIFIPATVSCVVVTNDDSNDDSNIDVTIQNTSNVKAYIRAAVVATWKDDDGNGNVYVYGGSKPTVSITPKSGWAQESDGYYYYSSAVTAGSSTEPLIDTYTYSGTEPDGYSLSIEVVAEAIQADPFDSADDAWSTILQ